jgi:hypothetical protein
MELMTRNSHSLPDQPAKKYTLAVAAASFRPEIFRQPAIIGLQCDGAATE